MATVKELNKYGIGIAKWFEKLYSYRSSETGLYQSAWQGIQPSLQWLREQGRAGRDWSAWLVRNFAPTIPIRATQRNPFDVKIPPTPTPEPTPTPTPTPVSIPTPRPRPYPTPAPRPTLPGLALRRAQRRAEWLSRRQAPTQALSNYPRLPQSWIPTPKVEYPAPGRPSGIREMRPEYRNLFARRPEYRNLFAWRRSKGTWW